MFGTCAYCSSLVAAQGTWNKVNSMISNPSFQRPAVLLSPGRCQVPLCKRRACGQADPSKGLRCARHAATARSCVIEGCEGHPIGKAFADHLGPAGFRCGRHGGGCNVAGCTRVHWGRVSSPDQNGPPGRRCYKHGGKTCTIPGCYCKPARHVREFDELGPPGVRCQRHCQKKSGPRHRRDLVGKSPPLPGTCNRADGKGWRCKRPVASGSRVCEYHYTAHVQKQRSKRRAACVNSVAKRPRSRVERQVSLTGWNMMKYCDTCSVLHFAHAVPMSISTAERMVERRGLLCFWWAWR